MGNQCLVCNHISKKDIEKSMLSGRSKASISREYNVPESSILNHERSGHISRQMITADSIQQRMSAEKLLDDVEMMLTKTKDLLEKSEKAKKYNLQISSTKTLVSILQMLSAWRIECQKMQMAQEAIDRENGITGLPTIDEGMSAKDASNLYLAYIRQTKLKPGASVVLLPQKDILTHRESVIPDIDDEQTRRQKRRELRRLRQQGDQPEMEVEPSAVDEEAEENKRLEEEINTILEWEPPPAPERKPIPINRRPE